MQKPSTFAERLKSALDCKQMTKAELSRLAGISKSSLTRYAKGDWEGKQDAVYAIAQALNVNEAWLMGYDAPMERVDYSDLLAEIVKENESGRPGAVEQMCRLFGTEHSYCSTHLCGDKMKASVLFYRAVDRRAAPELSALIETVEEMDFRELEKIRRLISAYCKASEPIREIIDTALKPYDEEANEEVQLG